VKAAILRFAAAWDTRFVDDPTLRRELMVDRGALIPTNRDNSVPVVVDHDMNRQIGVVRGIHVYPAVLPGGKVSDWYHASVELNDVPGWLRRDGSVSWGHRCLHEMELAGVNLLKRALIDEISVLTPARQPKEPLARVCWVGEPSAARTSSDRPTDGEVFHGGGLIRRPGIGQVLGVR
jgi:hypothetical protein